MCLLAPHASLLQIRTTSFWHIYAGAFITDTVLDSTPYKLRELYDHYSILLDTFYINRIKLTLVSTPPGTVNTKMQLT